MPRRAVISLLAALGAVIGAIAVRASPPGQVTSADRRAAISEADLLLRSVVLPAGSSTVTLSSSGAARLLAQPSERLFLAAQVDRDAFWRSDATPSAVIASVRAHLPPGAKQLGGGSGGGEIFTSYGLPEIDRNALGLRQVVVEAVRLATGTTAVRVDGEVQYLAPRPVDERIPPDARLLQITVTNNSREPLSSGTVTNPARVGQIANLVDDLPFGGNWSGVAFSCAGVSTNESVARFAFRATAGGRVLASLSEPVNTPTNVDPCTQATLTVLGQREPGLMEGGVLLRQVRAQVRAGLADHMR
jgi:hypothetical protein